MTRFATALAAFTALAQAQDFDLILRNGRIADGMGNPWYRADIGIRAGPGIGVPKDANAKRVIDVNSRIVAPGFIDMMAATSVPLLLDSESGGSKLQQGITTMMAGEGASAAPRNPATFRDELVTKGYKWTRRRSAVLLSATPIANQRPPSYNRCGTTPPRRCAPARRVSQPRSITP